MNMQIAGSVAVVAGGGGGFGRATARLLHEAGAQIAVLDLDEEKGEATARNLGHGAVFVRTDATDEDSVSRAIGRASELGPIRVAVICHGGGGGGGRTLARDNTPHSIAAFRRVLDVFLTGTFNVLRLSAAAMAENDPDEGGERGVIVNTASIAAFEGTIGQAAYSAAKGGVVGMTLPIARDLAAVGIRVVTIAPGTFLTGAYGDRDPDELEAHWAPAIPFPRRMGQPEEYAMLAKHIVENPYLNGEVIRIDGALRFTPKGV